eukprot:COSAG05_NODE_306_length_11691_cov_14.764665_6_plen_106_part_00
MSWSDRSATELLQSVSARFLRGLYRLLQPLNFSLCIVSLLLLQLLLFKLPLQLFLFGRMLCSHAIDLIGVLSIDLVEGFLLQLILPLIVFSLLLRHQLLLLKLAP